MRKQTVKSWARKVLRKARDNRLESDFKSFDFLQKLAYSDCDEDFIVYNFNDRSNRSSLFGVYAPSMGFLALSCWQSYWTLSAESIAGMVNFIRKGEQHLSGSTIIAIRCKEKNYTGLFYQPVRTDGGIYWQDSKKQFEKNPFRDPRDLWNRVRDFQARIEKAKGFKTKAKLRRKLKRSQDGFVLKRLKVPVGRSLEEAKR